MDALTFTFSANGTPPKQTCKQCRLRKVRCQGQRDPSQPCVNCERLEFVCSFSESTPSATPDEGDKPEPRRISKACTRCRQQKVRCSGTVPCASCRRKDLSCDYPTSARKKSRPSHKAGSISEDETRTTLTPDPDASKSPDHAISERTITVEHPHPPASSVNGTTSQFSSYGSPSSAAAVARLFDYFFEHIYPLPSYTFLHPATTQRRFELRRLEPCLVHAISAVASVRAPPAYRCADMEAMWAEHAESHIWQHLESPNIARLQTMLLVVLYRIEMGQLRRAFMLSALAGRAAAAMRLNHERPGKGTVSFEIRRRLMWSLKFVERYFSHGLPEFELCPVENLYIQLPSLESEFSDGTETMELVDDQGAYRTCVKLEMLRRDIMKLTRSLSLREEPYPQLPQLMEEFQENLDKIAKQYPDISEPLEPVLRRQLADQWLPRHLLMRLSWHQCHCDLYRLILRKFREAAPQIVVDYLDAPLLDAAEEQCIYHAKCIAQTLAFVNQESQQTRLLEFDFAICAYNASRLLLFVARFGQTSARPDENFAISRAELCLAALKRFFPKSILVKPIAEEMRRLIDEASNSHTAPSRLGSPKSSVLPLRDPSMQLSTAAKARQRLAVHSLLRQAGFSDGEEEVDEVVEAEKLQSSPKNIVSPGMMSSVSQISGSKPDQLLYRASSSEVNVKDHTTPITPFDTEAWQHSLDAGDLLHGWDGETAATMTGAPNFRSFTFPWLQREQADWEPEQTQHGK